MACVAALFVASPALLPFPSAASSATSASCSCRLRPAVVARAPRHQRARRALRRFDEVEGVSKKRRGIGGGGAGGSQASSTRKDKGLAVDFKESQVADFDDLEEDKFLNAVVKVYCTHIAPDYGLPWQKQRQHASSGSAFMIGDGKLLTNAHCVEHDTQVKVKRRGDDKKYIAKVLARGIECDLALLSVENEEFWKGTEPLHFGRLPCLQDSVTVVGYPFGGDTISVTKGVVSRIEVTPYAHGTSDLLGIQIDAAINPGNSGGPAFNDEGECIGVAFQVYRSDEAENIGYVIPTTVVSHFLNDYQKNGKYTGFPCLGVLLQKLENPALRESLKVPSSEGVLVRRVEPTAPASSVVRKGDVIVSFDGISVGCEATVPFRSTERIAFRYLTSQKYAGDIAQLGIIRDGNSMKVQTVLQPRKHLVPFHVEGGQPSYLIVAGLVFTPLTEPFIEEECEDTLGLKLLAKARYSLATFEGEQIVIVSQVLAHEVNIGYEHMGNQQVMKLNGTVIKNIHHLAHLVDTCKDKFLTFEFEDDFLVVLDREEAAAASSDILKEHAIPSVRSSDLSELYVDTKDEIQKTSEDFGESPVTNFEMGIDCLLWA
ncbi:protease Do-like 2, chloroplastic isoform X1 [Phragmites australis]|uniref:protease Do-like 2, chloroplastic isoform X1 n=1 Tax=Phragmites australis TaxID=29695 RepID=UPI002D7837B9|nr:protease Do-like 2, chloroplastic isoform X1 [Phragmites australis]